MGFPINAPMPNSSPPECPHCHHSLEGWTPPIKIDPKTDCIALSIFVLALVVFVVIMIWKGAK